jgi:hypothetical protein
VTNYVFEKPSLTPLGRFAALMVVFLCIVTESMQGYTANGGSKTFPAQTYTCATVQQQADRLHFRACGQQSDVLVSAPAAS